MSKRKRIIQRHLSPEALRDTMENKLRASTIQSGARYRRDQERKEIVNQMESYTVTYWECPGCHEPVRGSDGRGETLRCDGCEIHFIAGEY